MPRGNHIRAAEGSPSSTGSCLGGVSDHGLWIWENKALVHFLCKEDVGVLPQAPFSLSFLLSLPSRSIILHP